MPIKRPPKKLISFRLPPDKDAQLRRMAQERGLTFTDVASEALDAYLEQHHRPTTNGQPRTPREGKAA